MEASGAAVSDAMPTIPSRRGATHHCARCTHLRVPNQAPRLDQIRRRRAAFQKSHIRLRLRPDELRHCEVRPSIRVARPASPAS
jgi:hypothetical protein